MTNRASLRLAVCNLGSRSLAAPVRRDVLACGRRLWTGRW